MIMAVLTHLATVFLMFILHVHIVTSEVHCEVFAQQPGTAGVLFTEHILFSSQEVAKGTCASRCLQTELCVSFTFTGVMQPGNCQGHSEIMVLSDAYITEARAQTYAVREKEEWLQKSCSIDADCKTSANVKCRRNTCVCTPGYFYSENLNQCVSECPVSSLTPNFVQYYEAGLADHNKDTIYGDLASCIEACVQAVSFTCLNIENRISGGKCYLGDATNIDDPGIWIENESGWILYQRNYCPVSSLASNFALYDQAYITNHNLATHYVDTDSCKEACVQTASCLSADWYSSTTRCFLNDATVLVDPGSWNAYASG